MKKVIAFTVLGFTTLSFLIGIFFVRSMEMKGKALLAEADQTRQILIYIMASEEALKEGRINQFICTPTEANIPILEAGKR